MSEAANRGGMTIFAICLAVTVIFFIYILAFQPGPIDTIKFPVPAGMTKQTWMQQKQEWAKSTPEKIENGKKLFEANFKFHVKAAAFEKLIADLNASNNSSEIGIFNLITNGLTENVRNKYGYIPEGDRWDMTHYLRSLVKSPAVNNAQEWNTYLNYGL